MDFIRAAVEDGGLRFGRWKRLPKSRRFVIDYLHFARKVPSQPLVRHCAVPEVAKLRKQSNQRVGWSAIFMKAYALVVARHPELKCFLMPWPWLHVYEHPHQVGRLAVSRQHKGEEWLFFARIEHPDELELTEIQKQIDDTQSRDLKDVPLFKLQRKFSGLPVFLRRPVWWFIMYLSGAIRTGLTGTFGMTSVSSLGAVSVNPPTLGSMLITFGPVDDKGHVRVTFVYDHRLFDGGTIAKYLAEFEEILNGAIRAELQSLCGKSLEVA